MNLLSAGAPEEVAAYQEIFDELINADASYNAEVESSGDFEEQFQIRAAGGTLDVAAVPQPGAIPALVEAESIVSLEDMGFNIDELNALLGESSVAAGEYNGEHYGLPTNINLKSMVWYPKDDFDAAGYTVPTTWDELIALSDQIVADGSTPWCVGFQSEGSTGWPATDWIEDIMLRTAGPEVYGQWYPHEIPFNDPAVVTRRPGSATCCSARGTCWAAPTPRRTSRSVTRRCRCSRTPEVLAPPAGELHQRLLPGRHRGGQGLRLVPVPPDRSGGDLYAGELTVVGTNGNRPEVVDFLNQFIDQEVQCAMGGVQASSRISPNVNVGSDCYVNDLFADASAILTEALASGTGAIRRLGPDAGRGRERQLLDRHGANT